MRPCLALSLPTGKIVLGKAEEAEKDRDLELMHGGKSKFWMGYELISSMIMLAAMALLFTYVWSLTKKADFRNDFDVYDADTHAPARPFLTARNTSQSLLPIVTSTGLPTWEMPVAGEGERWRLPAKKPVGLLGVADMLQDARMMHRVMMVYMMLQSVNMVMIMFRLISHVMFQPKLAVLARTLTASIKDTSHYIVALVIWMLMFAMVGSLCLTGVGRACPGGCVVLGMGRSHGRHALHRGLPCCTACTPLHLADRCTPNVHALQVYLLTLGEFDSEMSELGTTTLLLFRLLFAQASGGLVRLPACMAQ